MQGPLTNTRGHFWLMIWEQRSKAVIMLNRVIEKGSVSKCYLWFSAHVTFFICVTTWHYCISTSQIVIFFLLFLTGEVRSVLALRWRETNVFQWRGVCGDTSVWRCWILLHNKSAWAWKHQSKTLLYWLLLFRLKNHLSCFICASPISTGSFSGSLFGHFILLHGDYVTDFLQKYL